METERVRTNPVAGLCSYPRSSGRKPISEQITLLHGSPLFAGLSYAESHYMLSCSRAKTFARREMLFSQGDPFNTLVLIQTGVVKITQTSIAGREIILRLYRSGDAVGFQTSNFGSRHVYSACAMGPCEAFVWDHRIFHSIEAQVPQITANIGSILSGDLMELEQMFSEIAFRTARQRLGLALLRLFDRVGEVTKDGVQVSLRREELSQMTGLTVFTISRVLARWAQSRLIVPRREAILVQNLGQFKSALNLEER